MHKKVVLFSAVRRHDFSNEQNSLDHRWNNISKRTEHVALFLEWVAWLCVAETVFSPAAITLKQSKRVWYRYRNFCFTDTKLSDFGIKANTILKMEREDFLSSKDKRSCESPLERQKLIFHSSQFTHKKKVRRGTLQHQT